LLIYSIVIIAYLLHLSMAKRHVSLGYILDTDTAGGKAGVIATAPAPVAL
jgi:hypothetical protein